MIHTVLNGITSVVDKMSLLVVLHGGGPRGRAIRWASVWIANLQIQKQRNYHLGFKGLKSKFNVCVLCVAYIVTGRCLMIKKSAIEHHIDEEVFLLYQARWVTKARKNFESIQNQSIDRLIDWLISQSHLYIQFDVKRDKSGGWWWWWATEVSVYLTRLHVSY